MNRKLRIGLVVCPSKLGRISQNIERTVKWLQAASDQNINILCLPELNITGYAAKEEKMREWAIPLESETVQKLQGLVQESRVTMLCGMAERCGSRVYATHLVIIPDQPIGIYRKLYLAPPEKSIFSPGQHIPVFKSHGFTFGVQLCYDAHFPELSTHMALKGADLIFIPHASPRGNAKEKFASWMRHLPARAYDNTVYIAACNQTGPNGGDLTFPGVAFVIGPDGNLIARDDSGTESMLVTDIDHEPLEKIRSSVMGHFLSSRRPEIFRSIDCDSSGKN